MSKHKHSWKEQAYYDAGYGISINCIIYWCSDCGSIKKNNKIIKPKRDLK